MKRSPLFLILFACCFASGCSWRDPLFHHSAPLAQTDEWGRLHQTPQLNEGDYMSPKHSTREAYYSAHRRDVQADPAYVSAAQIALRRLGYSCGEIDGVFGPETSDAIARLQKNHSMTVTGTLTIPVRRALSLP